MYNVHLKLIGKRVVDFLLELYSFLDKRQQRVKLSSSFSDWTLITGGMNQGSWLGPLIFIIYIDDLHPSCTTHKFMDDVTLTEVITKGSISADSNMAHYISHLELWSKNNSMKLNLKKMREMNFGSIQNKMLSYRRETALQGAL